MIKRLLLILVAISLGFICDTAIWQRTLDSFFPLIISVCLFIVFFALLMFNIDLLPARRSAWLFLPPVYFATTAGLTAQYPDSLKYKFSLGFIVLYLVLLSMTYLGGRLERYCVLDYLRSFRRLIACVIQRPAQFAWQLIRDIFTSVQENDDTDDASSRFSRWVGFWIFAALFALFWWADWVFGEFFRSLFNELSKTLDLGEANIWGIICWSYLILGVMLYAGTESRDDDLIAEAPQAFRHWLNYQSSAMVFIAVFVPLTIFSSLQIYCLPNRGNCLYIDGFPAQMETHYGFWALVAASGLVFLVVCWLDHVTVFVERWDRFVHTALNFVLFIYVMILLWAAGQNVSLQTAGISVERHILYARGGLFWLGLMFVMFIGYEHFEREGDFPYAALRVTTLLVGAFTFVGVMVAAL